jgi:mannose-1-phosphate guanylyltransferase/mannose-6-phosphate isomerase
MKVVILAGGSGTRLWPLSRIDFPKQFLKLGREKSLLQESVLRAMEVCSPYNIFVITNNNYKFLVKDQLKEIDKQLEKNIILEPTARNTAPAIALTVKYIEQKVQPNTKNEVIVITTSDHIISPREKFAAYLKKAEEIAQQGFIVTFGIKPDNPETGYGYIKASKKNIATGFKIEKFVEKPNLETAKKYLQSGNYFWNSGMFAFTLSVMKEEFEKHCQNIFNYFTYSLKEFSDRFHKMPSISIDYAIMEKTKNAAVLPMEINWSDVGSWDSLFNLMEKDCKGNCIKGDVIALNTENSYIYSEKRLVATLGIKNLIVVETGDGILIAEKGEAQKVKEIVKLLTKQSRKEGISHLTTARPWGSYTILEEGTGYKVKRITVNPHSKLSLQLHNKRSEHWVVIKGKAFVTIDNKQQELLENQSTYVPVKTKHRLENKTDTPVEIIEVQVGDYLEEDDIIRFDDTYGR